MRGLQPVEIPTKPYIKQYLENLFGPELKLNGDTLIGHFLFHLMDRSVNDEATDFSAIGYTVQMRIIIPSHVYHQRGHNLNKTNIKHFNKFIEDIVKTEIRFYLDFYINEKNYGLDDAIDLVQSHMQMPNTAMPYDTIKKDYYRYREKKKMPMLKGKKIERNCPLDMLMIQQYRRSLIEKKEGNQAKEESREACHPPGSNI